jgi:hypothetical protein
MHPVEEFMKRFFLERTAKIQRELEIHSPFRKKFFADSCDWDSRRRSVERSVSETIVDVRYTGDGAEVITSEIDPFPRLRYILKQTGETWLIRRVDVEFQPGKGWVQPRDFLR